MVQVQQSLRVPKDYIDPDGGWNVNVWMFLTAWGVFILSHCGYLLWDWKRWLCFFTNVLPPRWSSQPRD